MTFENLPITLTAYSSLTIDLEMPEQIISFEFSVRF